MTSAEIRQSFLDFFRAKEHTVIPSSSLLPSSPNLLFTNAGMNQFVPYFLGAEQAPYQPPRAADTQKCIRAGGKHNDLDDVGLDTYHHTFFEMLGNWSFGDYFKPEAIGWAWELLVERWKFPAERLYATVYCPYLGEENWEPRWMADLGAVIDAVQRGLVPLPDDSDQSGVVDLDAAYWWAQRFAAAGLDASVHVVPGNKKNNFWMMGETGPCGPCSEVHMDLTPAGDTRGALVNQGDARCIEIWNLVFIQFNANADGTYSPLPARHVDTGLGFERVTSILQGTQDFSTFEHQVSNYETDVFRPIFDEIEKLSGLKYGSTLPAPGSTGDTEQEKADVAFRVIADHLRTLSFAIADGILPGNTDRNYVLRRILRRAVRYGRTLGFQEPFFYQLVPGLIERLGDVFPELVTNRGRIEAVLKTEEESFNRTLDRGLEQFEKSFNRRGQNVDITEPTPGNSLALQPTLMGYISGEDAFELYDTYGFPLDLTELMARERGVLVDVEGFNKAMTQQRERSRAAQKKEIITAKTAADEPEVDPYANAVQTEFVGYVRDSSVANIEEIVEDGDFAYAVVNRSPFYAEMGGQVGDTGVIQASGQPDVPVTNTLKRGPSYYLKLANKADRARLPEGRLISLEIDAPRRRATEAHHTATHLLHWALHEVVGQDATQKGSYVAPERLRFDFNSVALTPAQLADVEMLVNQHALANDPVTWREVPYAEVRGRGDIMQFFSDKYGDHVRVVQIGGQSGNLNGYSMELCAGTHVLATGQLGAFKIVSEGAIASGVRRIEAVTGRAALHYFQEQGAAAQRRVEELEAKLANLNKAAEKDKAGAIKQGAEAFVGELWAKVDQGAAVPRVVERVALPAGADGGEYLQAVLNGLKGRKFKGVAVLAGVPEGAGKDGGVQLAVGVSPEFIGRFNAGKLLQQLAPMVGGKGGGKADSARGAGKDAGKVGDLLQRAAALLSTGSAQPAGKA